MRNALVAAAAHLRDNNANDNDSDNNAESYPEVPSGIEPQQHVAHKVIKRCSDSGHSLRIAARTPLSATPTEGRLG